jgi:hypothetical protein
MLHLSLVALQLRGLHLLQFHSALRNNPPLEML